MRVGDSRAGFYAADVLADLVPRAHQAGLAVVGWGFPFLHDPVDDARWSAEALAWRGPGGVALDGFSPDIELATEGVVLTERRARVYLGLVREAAGDRLLVATVYRPTDRLWTGTYPYAAMAAYVDAFAPMVYWGCTEPGRPPPRPSTGCPGCGPSTSSARATTRAPTAAGPVRPRPRRRYGSSTWPHAAVPSAPRSGCGSPSTTNSGRPCPPSAGA